MGHPIFRIKKKEIKNDINLQNLECDVCGQPAV